MKSLDCLLSLKTFSFILRGDLHCYSEIKFKFSLHHWQNFSPSFMATLRNKRKLAAVLRETPENTRNSGAQNVLDPELTQDYISQVSEEIEGRETKKLSKELSKTESRILGALSKLDEFLLNPQVGTCSVAVPGTSRNSNSESPEITGDRSSDYSHHSGYLNSPEAETYPHSITLSSPSFCFYLGSLCRRLPPVTAWSTPLIIMDKTRACRDMLCPYLKTKLIEPLLNNSLDKYPPPFWSCIFIYLYTNRNIYIYDPTNTYVFMCKIHTKSEKACIMREKS